MTEQPHEPKNWLSNPVLQWGAVAVGIVFAGTAGLALGGRGTGLEWPGEKKVAMALPAQPQAAQPVAPIILPAAPELDPASIVRGVINPTSESTIASKMTARITAMPYREGQSFAAGAVLARFDCSQIHATLNAAEAAASAYRKTYETNVELDQFEAVGKNEVAVSKANLGKAQAEAAAVSSQLSDCEVRAPFAGKVVEQIGHVKEIAASGQPLLKIQSGRDVELELIVPSKWLTWLRPGAAFAFKIDETGNALRGRVTRFGASVDPVSKTIRVNGVVTKSAGMVLAGMSGTAQFDDPRARPEKSATLPALPPTPALPGAAPLATPAPSGQAAVNGKSS